MKRFSKHTNWVTGAEVLYVAVLKTISSVPPYLMRLDVFVMTRLRDTLCLHVTRDKRGKARLGDQRTNHPGKTVARSSEGGHRGL